MAADDTTKVERVSERELSITRLFAAPRPLVYRAWSEAALFRRWWVPASVPGMRLAGCEMDVRTGGQYRLEFAFGDTAMAFHGRYLEVVPGERMVWTNDEDAAGAVTTVTFHDHDGQTLVRVHEQYPTAEALAEALDGSAAALPEQLDQLAALLAADGQG